MNVNAILNGESVTIVSMEKQRLTALIAYIDAQGGPGNLKLTEIPLEDLPLVMATGAEVPAGGPCIGAVYSDEFDSYDSNEWQLSDVSGNMTFDGAMNYTGADKTDQGYIASSWEGPASNIWSIENADFDICCEIEITEQAFVATEGGFGLRLLETVSKGTSLNVVFKNNGQIWAAGPGGSENDTEYSPISTPSTFLIRMARIGNDGYIWIWNVANGQWEWNGSSAGWSAGSGIDQRMGVKIGVYSSTDNSNYTLGSCNYFYLNSGSRYIYP